MDIAQVMIFSWLNLLLVKSEAVTFEVSMANQEKGLSATMDGTPT